MKRLGFEVKAWSLLFMATIATSALGPSQAWGGCAGTSTGAVVATQADVHAWSLTVDVDGKVYVVERERNVVRVYDQNLKTNKTKLLKLVAGSPQFVAGDSNGSRRAAWTGLLNFPHGVSVGANGKLYIAEFGNRKIRTVDAACTMTTAATDPGDPAGIGVNKTTGTMYIPEYNYSRVQVKNSAGSDLATWGDGSATDCAGGDILATQACFDNPLDATVDASGNVYIADTYHQRVRKVDTNGIVTTVAGSGVSTDGFTEGAPATSVFIHYPMGVAVDSQGNVYIAEEGKHRITKVDALTQTISRVAGGGFDCTSTNPPDWPLGDGGLATDACLMYPTDVAVDAAGNLYIADAGHNRVRKVGTDKMINTIIGNGY